MCASIWIRYQRGKVVSLQAGFLEHIWVAGLQSVANSAIARTFLYLSYKTKQNKTKQNKTKQNKTKQNKTKRNETKQNKTKRNETKQNKTKHTHHTETPSSPGSVECTMKRIITNLKFCSHSVCS